MEGAGTMGKQILQHYVKVMILKLLRIYCSRFPFFGTWNLNDDWSACILGQFTLVVKAIHPHYLDQQMVSTYG
jgi:hypothetical protein